MKLIALLMLTIWNALWLSSGFADAGSEDLLKGKYISVLGDSISTYTGWSDAEPITDPDCKYRFGEAYYGPAGGDFHNTDMLVSDTWWHQAATELGAEILMVNSGNSTGLLYASYPANAEWQHYLQDMLAYKSRPYYLGKDGKAPDIIALYIGSNEVGKMKPQDYGSVDQVDFASLISKGENGYVYATPTTVAEAYCILLHKVSVTYPNAEVYCFTVVPNAGGGLVHANKRLASVLPFNEMVKGVAAHYGAIVVDLLDAFRLDPNQDGVATQADWDTFKTYYHEDPHPNAAGFDVITRAFVTTIRENTNLVAQVESKAGLVENVPLTVTKDVIGGKTVVKASAIAYVTPNGMTVDYVGETTVADNGDTTDTANYTSASGYYRAAGGLYETIRKQAPALSLRIPLTAVDDDATSADETLNTVSGTGEKTTATTGDPKASLNDGIYDYTVTEKALAGGVYMHARTTTLAVGTGMTETGMTHVYNPTEYAEGNDLVNYTKFTRPTSAEEVPAISEGYDVVYIGADQLSSFYSAHVETAPRPEFADEEPVYTDDESGESYYVGANHRVFEKRNLTVPRYYFPDKVVEGKRPARWDSIQQFVLSDAHANLATAYCAWPGVSAEEGYSYRMQNVQDADHYTDAQAQMLRTVALNGYWGTKSGYGSLASMKEMMLASGKFTQEEADALTDGMAMTATQYAVWTFSKEKNDRYINVYYTSNGRSVKSADKADADLIMKLYHYLISLKPTVIKPEDQTTYNTIINEKNFLDHATVTVKGKPADHANNQDADPGNDVYQVDLSFKLKVQPVEDSGDQLVMTVIDGNEDVICSACIAGTSSTDKARIYPDNNRIYTFEDVLLQEGTMNITFLLTGVQHLGKDVYLYTSELKDNVASQSFVGVAEGARNVNVSMNIELELVVSDDVLTTRRIWRTEKNLPTPAPSPTQSPTLAPTATPYIDLPQTGDAYDIEGWVFMFACSFVLLMCLAANHRKHLRN